MLGGRGESVEIQRLNEAHVFILTQQQKGKDNSFPSSPNRWTNRIKAIVISSYTDSQQELFQCNDVFFNTMLMNGNHDYR